MKEIKDHFSTQAEQYARFRPHYPETLFQFLYDNIRQYDCAWDCGTGNGQVAAKLADKFKNVFATDISEQQLGNAVQKQNITYTLTRAEQTSFQDNFFDLITVAQAIHWFDFPLFYKEVLRVSKPQSLLAVWGYNLATISPEIDSIIDNFYHHTIGDDWDEERKHIEQEYKTIPFPFEEIVVPPFEMIVRWDLHELIGYLYTWSAVQKYIRRCGSDPVVTIEKQLKSFWKPEEKKEVNFPLFVRIGRVEK